MVTCFTVATAALLFLARITFPAHNSLVGTLQERYSQDLEKKVRTLEKLDFEYKKSLLELNLLTSWRNNNVNSEFLHFKVSNKQSWSSAVYITCQKRLLNQEILNKQKGVKSLEPMLKTIKNNLNTKMNCTGYIHVWTIFLVSNDKNISEVKNTQSKKLSILLLNN